MKLPVDYTTLDWRKGETKAVRDEYVKLQGGTCFYCGHHLSSPPPEDIQALSVDWRLFPPGFQKHPVHLQHDHQTNMTEGAVHMKCNAVMWQYEGR